PDGITGESVHGSKPIDPPVTYLQQALPRADPQAAIAAPVEAAGSELTGDPRQWIVLNFPSHKLLQSTVRCQEQSARIVLDQRVCFSHATRKRVLLRRTGCPAPQSGLTCEPENAVVVQVYGANAVAKHSLPVTLNLRS